MQIGPLREVTVQACTYICPPGIASHGNVITDTVGTPLPVPGTYYYSTAVTHLRAGVRGLDPFNSVQKLTEQMSRRTTSRLE